MKQRSTMNRPMNDMNSSRGRRRLESGSRVLCLWACFLASAFSTVLANGGEHVAQYANGQVHVYDSADYFEKSKQYQNGDSLAPIHANVADSPSVVEAAPPSASPIVAETTRNADSCPGGGCDICPFGVIVDDSKLVTISIPGINDPETATCGEWFATGCNLITTQERCTDYQGVLFECCASSGPTSSAPAPTEVPTIGQPVAAPIVAPIQAPSGATRSEIVELVPFDVTVGLSDSETGVDVFALTDIVEDWLGAAFDANQLGDGFARFTTVILDYTDEQRLLQQTTSTTFVASYTGVTVWTRQGDLKVPDETVVVAIQTQAFIRDQNELLFSLQDADDSTGLGSAVTSVQASINSLEVSFIQCVLAMNSADANNDSFLNQNEYIAFLNGLADNDYAGASLATVSVGIRRNFFQLRGDNGQIDISGSRPGEDPTDEQLANLQNVCTSTMDAIFPRQPVAPPIVAPIQVPTIGQPIAAPIQVPTGSTPAPIIFAPIQAPSSSDCPEGGCDICPLGVIVDDSKVVTITVPGTEVSETATCGEWFLTGCSAVSPDNCADFQSLLSECCSITEPPGATPAPTFAAPFAPFSPVASPFAPTAVPSTSLPTMVGETLGREIWADAEDGAYPWDIDEPCIQHPTFRFGTSEAYTAAAVAATNAFKDPRLTQEIREFGIKANVEANIPMSNCGSLDDFAIELENAPGLIDETILTSLRNARLGITEPPGATPAPTFAAPFAPFSPFAFPSAPTAVPTMTFAPTVTATPTVLLPCFTSLGELHDVERAVSNLNVVRNYVLCADTTFFSTTVPLFLRKNMHVYCGEIGGSSDNNCIITGGLLAVSTPFDTDVASENVIVQGVTFQDATEYALLIGIDGDFQFIDCIFSDHTVTSQVPVLIEWLVEDSIGLKVDFTDCVFEDCASAPNSRLGLVNLGGDEIDITFTRTLFRNNDYNVPGSNDVFNYGVIVEKFGSGLLTFDSCCFINNRAVGNGLVNVYEEDLSSTNLSNNFGAENNVEYLGDFECEFVALINFFDPSFPTMECADFDANICAINGETSPTSAPTAITPMPVMSPKPTFAPSKMMSSKDMPSVMASEDMPSTVASEDLPTVMGSEDSPTVVTEDPTRAPAQGPTLAPVEGPTIVFSPALTPSEITPSMMGSGDTPAPAEAPTIVFSPALTPSEITPSMITPSILTPSILTPSFLTPSFIKSPSAYIENPAPFDQSIGGSCSDPTSCDICAGGNIIDGSKVVTIAIPGIGGSETATCGEWLASVCLVDDSDDACSDYQILLIECCTEQFPLSDRSFTQSVSIEPFIVKFIGEFDLTEENAVLIINVIDQLIPEYLEMKVGAVLDSIGLQMKFMKEESVLISSAYGGRKLQSSTTALIEISGELGLEGASEEELLVWNEQQVTAIVKDFFSVSHLLEKLFKALVEKGLALQEIIVHDGNTDSIVTEEGATTQSTNKAGEESGGSNKNRTGLVVAVICGSLICIVLAVALFVNTRRRRNRRFRIGGTLSSVETDTLNLRSGKDDLPDCNASTASSHASFPGVRLVFGDELVSDNNAYQYQHQEAGASDSDISLGELLGDYDDIELNEIEDDASSLQAIRSHKSKRRSNRRDDEELERAKAWAKQIRNTKPLSAPQPRDDDYGYEYTIDFS